MLQKYILINVYFSVGIYRLKFSVTVACLVNVEDGIR